jgi:hydroxymethylpyrimidine/phosphomethylpyrimidine kinase
MHTPTVLTIAGFDPYGGAGIQIDTKTIHALGGYALSAATAITAQNSQGVSGVEPVSARMLHLQLSTLLDDIKVDAVKIGMLANAELVEVVAEILKKYRLKNVVLDTVLVSSSGKVLLAPEAVEKMVVKLFPLCSLVTPNLDETNTFLKCSFQGDAEEIAQMAEGFFAMGAENILFKGGHTAQKEAIDYLASSSGVTDFRTPRVDTSHTHGTGCLLSSAIAACLAKGESLPSAVAQAKVFLYGRLQEAEALAMHYRTQRAERKEPIF